MSEKAEKLLALKKSDNLRVSAILPVYCEEKTVANVVAKLLENPLIDEVICVNDASEDKSLEILKSFGSRINLIIHKKNKGKGAALASGVRIAKGDIVCFFDADLLNLSDYHIFKLLEPLIKKKAKSVVGYPILHFRGFKSWSGERAYFRKDLLPLLKEMALTRFGVEIFLNEKFEKKVKFVSLDGLKGYYKFEKFDFDKAVGEYLKLFTEVTRLKLKMMGFDANETREILKLFKIRSIDDLKDKVAKVRNAKIRRFLKNNVLRYLSYIQDRWRVLTKE